MKCSDSAKRAHSKKDSFCSMADLAWMYPDTQTLIDPRRPKGPCISRWCIRKYTTLAVRAASLMLPQTCQATKQTHLTQNEEQSIDTTSRYISSPCTMAAADGKHAPLCNSFWFTKYTQEPSLVSPSTPAMPLVSIKRTTLSYYQPHDASVHWADHNQVIL